MDRILYIFCVQLFALSFLSFGGLSQSSFAHPIDDNCPNPYEGFGLPTPWGKGVPELFVCRDHYILSFNGETKNPNWVIEFLTKEKTIGSAKRRNNFSPDDNLPEDQRSELSDFKGSGYDRGHQAPAADFKFNQAAMDDSFYLSNMSPQVGVGFNRGTWAKLESKIRDWSKSHEALIVITGPIFNDFEPTIGANKVVVPDEFYKIAFDPETFEAIAFILPNERQPADSYKTHVVSIQVIERKTGLNFFPALNFRDQNYIETSPSKLWD
jgi:endonuclease G